MALTKEDLAAIEKIVNQSLEPIKTDIKQMKSDISVLKSDLSAVKIDISIMKSDLNLLASINQLEEIKKDKRLMTVFAKA